MTNSNAKILVVDDVAENRDLFVRRLTRLGFHLIDQPANGIEALPRSAAGLTTLCPSTSQAKVSAMTGLETRFERSTLATPEAISDLTDEVMAFLDEQGVEVRAAHHTALVLSEVLTNLGTHGDCADRPARVAVTVEPDKVTGEIVDTGPQFDPRLAPDPSLDASAAERPIGGLGLYLVRKLSCSLEYARRNDENCMTFAISRGTTARGR